MNCFNKSIKIREINISADQLISKLLILSEENAVCILDSCGAKHLDSRFLIAGIEPIQTFEFSNSNAADTLEFLDKKISDEKLFSFFSLSYEFGLKINQIKYSIKSDNFTEPDVFLSVFDCLLVHNYDEQTTYIIGNSDKFDEIETLLHQTIFFNSNEVSSTKTEIKFDLTKEIYLSKLEQIKEFIRQGKTYQTNFTQQISAKLPESLLVQQIFFNLRKNNPAPFAAFFQRPNSTVISASPERFFKIENQIISTSPIKGTRPRGKNQFEDEQLKIELLNSEKDRAENIMIVDLLRNDLGRICEFGSVQVEKLCELEQHPSLFHLVSTISGKLKEKIRFSQILQSVFPCGSITGAPKISTMQIIEQLEPNNRGLSMGAIGYSMPHKKFKIPGLSSIDMSVAIRTMIVRNKTATFNVGGGIVIDSDSENEYEETLVKAKALLNAINAEV